MGDMSRIESERASWAASIIRRRTRALDEAQELLDHVRVTGRAALIRIEVPAPEHKHFAFQDPTPIHEWDLPEGPPTV